MSLPFSHADPQHRGQRVCSTTMVQKWDSPQYQVTSALWTKPSDCPALYCVWHLAKLAGRKCQQAFKDSQLSTAAQELRPQGFSQCTNFYILYLRWAEIFVHLLLGKYLAHRDILLIFEADLAQNGVLRPTLYVLPAVPILGISRGILWQLIHKFTAVLGLIPTMQQKPS